MSAPGAAGALRAEHDAPGGAFAVHLAGAGGEVAVARYLYRSDAAQLESPRPHLHPLRTPAGHEVTLYRPHDHVWHRGIAWSLPHVGPHNFWGGPTHVRGRGYVQLDNDGSMDTVEVLAAGEDGGGGARFAHQLAWHAQSGEEVVRERRELVFTAPAADAWVLTADLAMRNVSGGDLPLGSPTTNGRENAGYGGLFWRGPRSFTGGRLVTERTAGGDELRGQRAEWMAFSGRHDGVDAASTVLLLDDRDNPQHPPQWFARSEQFAALCPAPFFSQEVPFGDGEELRFRCAVVVADGASGPERGRELAALGRAALAAGRTGAARGTAGAWSS
ncbi:DUF6807 domain-containing protein [Kineococcus sp. SYSU DK005]|uniref:DUF6807 domain-containing protein n=1 Tax=Kineococcus sp. SYSU DK005 TaxID=3383126 RepID=UPI003D7DC88F